MSASLIEQLADDVAAAFPDLIDDYGAMVTTLACRLTDASTGEDIAQEVFLRAYRALLDYDARRIAALDLRPWLATITRNLVRNEYRRRARRPTVDDDGVDPPDAGAPDIADLHDDRDTVDRLLSTLPDLQREAVVLRHIVGLSAREVALTMGCPEGTAKSHTSRGLARLRAVLDGHAPELVESEDRA